MITSILSLALLVAPEERIIVQLAPGADPAAVGARSRLPLRDVTPGAPFALYGAPPARLAVAEARLRKDPRVVWAEDDPTLRTAEDVAKGSSLSVVGDRSSVVQKNVNALSQVGWSASLAGSAGRTVRLAVLDNGLSRLQTALWAKVDASMDVFGGNADDAPMGVDSNGDGTPDEGVGHGTMVASITDMVAPKVRLVIAKVADSDGRATSWSLVKGMAFAVANGAEVANVSLGSPDAVAAFNDVAEWAADKGLLVVAAIGNENLGRAWYPSRSTKALCVAGLASDDTKASFSNWDGGADACAPAVGIVSQFWDGSLASWSGTSFAAPFVAAGVADCLRRTGAWRSKDLISVTNKSGASVDGVNRTYRGQLGTLLNITALNAKMKGNP